MLTFISARVSTSWFYSMFRLVSSGFPEISVLTAESNDFLDKIFFFFGATFSGFAVPTLFLDGDFSYLIM